MADTARNHETTSRPGENSPPRLQVARDDNALLAEPAGLDEGLHWRRSALGAAVGFSLVVVTITVVGTLAGIGAGGALGLGIFVGAFGGIGFGFMVGGQVSFAREFDARPTRAIIKEHREHP